VSYSLFPPTDLDLQDAAGTRTVEWAVVEHSHLHLEVTLATGTWPTAVVELKRTIGGNEWFSFVPAITLVEGLMLGIDVGHVTSVVAEITTNQGGAGELTIVAWAESQDTQESVSITPDGYATRLDEASATVTYVGKAATGTATSAGAWQVQRLTDTGSGLTVEWADGNGAFDNVWDNRASLNYS
jgi:hypothetical protein